MSKEYINRELLENALEDENKNGNFVFTANWIMEIVDNLPNADVAPKSEVEELLTRLNNVYVAIDIAEDDVYRLEKENEELKYTNQHLFEFIAEVKREIAIEIFDEIEGIIEASEYELLDDFGDAIAKCHNERMIIDDLAELKKKYTEGENGTQ